MGKILSSRRHNEIENKIILEVEVNHEEVKLLQGHYNDIHVITDNVASFETNIATRGRNAATKYFLIPRKLRANLNYNNLVNCQKIDTKDKTIFVYVVDKFQSKSPMTRFENVTDDKKSI